MGRVMIYSCYVGLNIISDIFSVDFAVIKFCLRLYYDQCNVTYTVYSQ
jgi:hypothetical protein